MIPLIRPYITGDAKRRVNEVLDSGFLTEGPVTRELETVVARYLGVAHCLAVTSCTTGLEMALRCLGVSDGDEVIVPDYTYPATASAVALVGATPVIVDVDPQTMVIDYDALEAAVTPATKAVIPVSLFGNPVDYDRLSTIKKKHGLFVIEDAACALGAEFKGRMVGACADISVFSCHPRKFVTTGEGGLVTTGNAEWAEWMLSFKHFGMGVHESRQCTSFDRIGTNLKLSNILAAVGLSQMDMVEELLDRRRQLAALYQEALKSLPGISLPTVTEGGLHSYQSFCVFVDERDRVMASMREKGVEVQIGTYSLHMHKAFNANDKVRLHGAMQGSRRAFEQCLTLPLFHEMTREELDTVVRLLAEEVG
ncbi:DegT/DnrJ/EryC1/StrS family aminotransferase [Salidesulfovibrio onnuriiensis]|uniref:DegT/DnrJ/EryC1/StrS family aminotransferase n=1 Tax=Salidesulfovibrio onnuriiensis TaxID=2583823 RepID=UPI0011CAD5D9|nr:DegT/DnrJ/EryC1/StrS aminotransferase family protein [Salidesulfovibrio onnuriiensis]